MLAGAVYGLKRLRAGTDVGVLLPVLDHDHATGAVAAAHGVCPSSNAIRRNMAVKITANDHALG